MPPTTPRLPPRPPPASPLAPASATRAFCMLFGIVLGSACGTTEKPVRTASRPAPATPASRPATARAASRPAPRTPRPPRFRFVDTAAAAGLYRPLLAGRPTKDHLLDSSGSGCAFLDYDLDGCLDIYLLDGFRLSGNQLVERGRNSLWRGRGDGTFEDVTDAACAGGEGDWAQGVAVADVDLDGHPDILVTCFGRNVLLRNRGDGTFENIAAAAGIESPGWNTGAAFFDADLDGDLDLYVAKYVDCTLEDVLCARRTARWKEVEKVAAGPSGLRGAADVFFLNESGVFSDATAAAGLTDRYRAFGFAVRAFDADSDGDLDVFVANDSNPNYLYLNQGGGRFEEAGIAAGVAFSARGVAQASMGVATGDMDGDGLVDLFVTNFSEDQHTLFLALGRGLFEDASERTGIARATFLPLSWGTAAADLDSDGDLDLVIASGHIYPQVDDQSRFGVRYEEPLMLLENEGGLRFRNVTDDAGPGFAIPRSARGLAAGDVDGDGDLDLLVTCLDRPPLLLRNDSPQGRWLRVAVVSPPGAPSQLGARVTVEAGGRTYVRDVASGDSYLSAHDPRLHFGLGEAAMADRITARFSDGITRSLESVPAGSTVTITR